VILRRSLHRLLGRPDLTEMAARSAVVPLDVDWLAGTCLVLRRAVLDVVGLLDERFFLYWEDVDWCLRAKRGGWRVVFDPRLTVTHIGGVATGSRGPRHYYRSMVRFYRKWYGGPVAAVLVMALAVYAPVVGALRRLLANRR
jgi:GT2 family glycosyltransferase